jgi:hypothetical protein
MRKLLLLVGLLLAGVVIVRRIRSRDGGADRPPAPAPVRPVPASDVPPPPTTNGERVVLTSIWTLQGRGDTPSREAVVDHVAAGGLDPDGGTVDALLHRLVGSGLLSGGDGEPYRLTAVGQGALLDGSPARPSSAGDAAEELSSPTPTR